MLQRILEELQDIVLNPRVLEFSAFSPLQGAVMFDIEAQSGRYKGKILKVALSFQETSYPEYPPHFVHLKSSVVTERFPRQSTYQFEDEEWSIYSLPPSDFWDTLDSSQKNMVTYVKRHIYRIIAEL